MSDMPICDTCGKPAVWSEVKGWGHWTRRHVTGIPKNLDKSGHEVTTVKWIKEYDSKN